MKSCPWTLKDVFIVFIYAIALFFVFCFWLVPVYLLILSLGGASWHFIKPATAHLKKFLDLYAILFFYASLFIAIKVKIFKKYRINEFEFFFRRGRIREDIFYAVAFYLKFILIIFLF